MDDGQKLTDVVGAMFKDGAFEQLYRRGRLCAEIHKDALVFHLSWIARASGINGDGKADRLFLGLRQVDLRMFLLVKTHKAACQGGLGTGFVGKALVQSSRKALYLFFAVFPTVVNTWVTAFPNDIKLVFRHGGKSRNFLQGHPFRNEKKLILRPYKTRNTYLIL